MPLDTNLLYGEMVGSWIAHLGIPFATYMLINAMPTMEAFPKLLIFIGVCTVLSFACQYMLLAILQASSCDGIKDYGSIATAAAIGALITAGMVSIPSFIESMRLVVSQMLFSHKPLLTPQLAKINEILTDAGDRVLKASLTPDQVATVQKGGAAITLEEYDAQTFQEIASGASYWSAFAGAYGIGIGSLFAASCRKSS